MDIARIRRVLNKPVVLTGLMGAGKTSIGKEMASLIGCPFIDADSVIVERAGMAIADIFDLYGEPRFRALERSVIGDLLAADPPVIIGLGGGAFMAAQTRSHIEQTGISIFIKADLDILVKRVGSGRGRPLLERSGDPASRLRQLIEVRYPVYQQADMVVEAYDEPLDKTTHRVMEALYMYLEP